MQKKTQKQQRFQQSKSYYQNSISARAAHPFVLGLSLTSNPFLKDSDTYKYLRFQLTEYNKRVECDAVCDQYESLCFQRLHAMLSDLAQIEVSGDQVKALEDVSEWFKVQYGLIEQRRMQGEIRYQITKEYRHFLKVVPQGKVLEKEEHINIPSYLIKKQIHPYQCMWRTAQKQLEMPLRRLKEYKRKTINIATFVDGKKQVKPQRVLYPMPVKSVDEVKEEQHDDDKLNIDGQVQQGEQVQTTGQVEAPGQQKQPVGDQQDMGGFGEQPEQPDQDQQIQDVNDKLAPKHKIYAQCISQDKQKKYKQAYQFYLGNEGKTQRTLQLRYIRRFHDNLRKHQQDYNQTQIAHDWAKKKSKINKQLQRKLQQMKMKPCYIYSHEEMGKEEIIGVQDQLKFGFTTVMRGKPKKNDVDFSMMELPPIGHFVYPQNTIRRDRLNSLKNKFAKILNISQYQQRQSIPSLCQYTSRRRGLSQIIRNHSHSKQRLIQLQEVTKIKQKLTRAKINLNIKVLVKGLCLPENQEQGDDKDRKFPNPLLPSNPFLVQVKKKKKKG